MIYLDNAAACPMQTEAIKEIQKAMLMDFANPSSQHKLGEQALQKINAVRELILSKLNASSKYDLIFTSSATESNNLAINSIPLSDSVAYTKSMHPSLVQPLTHREFASHQELPLEMLVEKTEDFLPQTENTHLVIPHVNSLTGHISNISELTKKIKHKNLSNTIHVDATQSFGKLYIDLEELDIDTLTINSNKMGGPKGIAALVYKKDHKLIPLMQGGLHEFGHRPSTVNTPAIIGWSKAVELSFNDLNKHFERILALKTLLVKKLKAHVNGFDIPKESWHTSPFILLMTLKEVPSDVLLRLLQDKDIIVSSSTACSSKSKKTIPTFDDLKIAKDLQKSALRLSFSYKTNAFEIDTFCDALFEQLSLLKKLKRKN